MNQNDQKESMAIKGQVAIVTGGGTGVGQAVAIALAEAVEQGRIKKGHVLGLAALGAGFTWGGVIVRI